MFAFRFQAAIRLAAEIAKRVLERGSLIARIGRRRVLVGSQLASDQYPSLRYLHVGRLGRKRILPGCVRPDQFCAKCARRDNFGGTPRAGWQAFRCGSSKRSGQVAAAIVVERKIADTANFSAMT